MKPMISSAAWVDSKRPLSAMAVEEAKWILDCTEREDYLAGYARLSSEGQYGAETVWAALAEALDTLIDAPNTESWLAFLQRNPEVTL